jgi:hypothetical protein
MERDHILSSSLAQTQITSALVREIWDPKTRRRCADRVAATLNRVFGIDPASFPASGRTAAQELRDLGISFAAPSLSTAQAGEVRAHLAARRPPLGTSATERFVHPVKDIIEAPHLLETALSDDVLAPLARYFGTMPFLTGLRVWWLEHGPPLDGDQAAHRDNVDVCFSKLFIYLTDVGANDAPHKFYKGTHSHAHVKKRLLGAGVPHAQLPTALRYVFEANFENLKTDITDLFKDDVVTITGKAGTSFLADTSAIHRAGIPAPGHHRLMFSAIYAMNLDVSDYSDMAQMRSLPAWRDRVGSSPLARHAVQPWMQP